ncbi:glycerophosphodiester phosphodiesterase family protein [Chitinophaga sp.]|uniref:glycerophosphodiester phosphodiesterase family protein n=1 Tax=Chitinophaga sp. TaxID=1869181 RepID=UPI0031D8D522
MKRLLGSFLMLASLGAAAQTDVQAHRGGRALMPENTIPAMKHAIDLGARTLELDCVISEDKKVVVSHDLYMSADFMRTPEGKDIDKANEQSYKLYTMPYDSIRKYDAGTKPHKDFPRQVKMKTYKPLLSELIDSVEAYVKAHHLKPVYYNMETKCSPDGDNIFHPAPGEFVGLMMQVIRDKGIQNRVTVQSFDIRTLQVIHKLYPKQKLALLVYGKDSFETNIEKLGFTPDIYSPYSALVTKELVTTAHNKKVQVLPWTVNDPQEMQKMMELGVDGIITDDPEALVKLAGSYQKK